MKVLGISAFYHDSAACLVADGRIVAAAEEERFSRRKHDSSFPASAIAYCLREAGVAGKDLEAVSFYEKPLIKFERILESQLAFIPSGFKSFALAMPRWVRSNLWIKDIIAEQLGYPGPIVFPEHHASHDAAAFFPSPYREAAALTMDGVGEWATTSFGAGSGNTLELQAEIRFPHSLGLLYTAFTYYLGFKVNSGEYKVMGLAPYGAPRYKGLILDHLIDLRDDGSFRLDMDYFGFGAVLPAVTHADGSARIQTVDESSPPAFRALLQEMDRRFGCPVILNTSFNVRDEPMVCTPEEAFACFRRAGLDGLFLENLFIDKNDLAELPALPAEEAGPMELD